MAEIINIPSFLLPSQDAPTTYATSCTTCNTTCNTCQYCGNITCQNCNASCEDPCEYGCQSCNTACQKSCQSCNTCQSCNAYCQSSCETSCQSCNSCQTTCNITCQGQHVHAYTSRHEYISLDATNHQKKSYCSCGKFTATNEAHTFAPINYYYSNGFIKCKCSYCSYVKDISTSPLFSWDTTKTQRTKLIITAVEMNKFITLLNQKVRAIYRTNSLDIMPVAINDRISASLINTIRDRLIAIKAMNIPDTVIASSPSTPRSVISASYMNQLVTSLNSIR